MPPRNPLAGMAFALMVTILPLGAAHANEDDGIIKVRSAYPIAETVARIKKDIADRGIRLFTEIDQSQLADEAEITLRPSTLLEFGNPALGTPFITANPLAGLDWPVRLLVTQDDDGTVWAAYTDFDWVARRHRITKRALQFKIANDIIASITSSVEARGTECRAGN